MLIKKVKEVNSQSGFSLIEMLISMVVSLLVLAAGISAFSTALSMRAREASKTDAVTSTQAALNVMTREIGNAGFGLTTNGIVLPDSNNKRLRFRSNLYNNDNATSAPGEDILFSFDTTSGSVVRFDANAPTVAPVGVVNRISDVEFGYCDYSGSTSFPCDTTPSADTCRIEITLTVFLPDVVGQPSGQTATVKSDVTLRNAPYMRGQY